MSTAEEIFKQAFDRLKKNVPINVPNGTKVSQNNIAKEAGKHPTALKKAMRNKRNLEERYQACNLERDQLASICEAQLNLIGQLQDEISDLKQGVKPLSRI